MGLAEMLQKYIAGPDPKYGQGGVAPSSFSNISPEDKIAFEQQRMMSEEGRMSPNPYQEADPALMKALAEVMGGVGGASEIEEEPAPAAEPYVDPVCKEAAGSAQYPQLVAQGVCPPLG